MSLGVHAPRSGQCEVCQKPFIVLRMSQRVCSPRCAIKKAKADRAKGARELRERKAALRTPRELEQECRRIVQAIARIRDRHHGCISCDKPANWDGQWHGSHFRSVGACSSLSLHLWNINRACWICNKLYSGRIDQYEQGLIERYGQERVDWLKSQNQVVRRSREYLERFKRVMGKRLRRMEKRICR
jgi:hypothetical protein